MAQSHEGPKSADARQSDFAPALDSEPVYERIGEGRWDIAPEPQPFAPPFVPSAAGHWADARSAYDVNPAPGPGFLDPGTHALLNHVAPLLASDSMPVGALAGASTDLTRPIAAEGAPPVHGGGDDDGGEDDGENRRRWWQWNRKQP